MITTIEEFIERLDALMEKDNIAVSTGEDNEPGYEDKCFILDEDELEEAASGLFVTNRGRCNWNNIDALRVLSGDKYYITPGETDSFGWLSGCINTPKGIIVYL